MYQEENEDRKISPILLIITGIIALVLVVIFFYQIFVGKDNNEEYSNISSLEVYKENV